MLTVVPSFMGRQHLSHSLAQRFHTHRLEQIIGNRLAHSLNRARQRTVRRQNNDRQKLIAPPNLLQQIDAIAVAELQIEQDQVDLLVLEDL